MIIEELKKIKTKLDELDAASETPKELPVYTPPPIQENFVKTIPNTSKQSLPFKPTGYIESSVNGKKVYIPYFD